MPSSLEDLGIVTSDGFRGSHFTNEVKNRLWSSKGDEAIDLIDQVVASGYLSANHYRVLNARNIVRDVLAYIARVRDVAQQPESDVQLVELNLANRPAEIGLPRLLTQTHPAARLVNYANNIPTSSKTIDDLALTDTWRSQLKAAGFDNHAHPGLEAEEVWVENNCRVTAGPPGSLALVSGDGSYLPTRSGRLAKSSRINLVAKVKQEIPEALVLPFSHSPANYYHSLVEMVYGLRHIQRVDKHCPIIYGNDHFGILPVVSKALQIDEARLISADDAQNTLIATAYVAGTNPFVWSSNLTRFFRAIGHRVATETNGSPDRIYISRRNSSRSPSYEPELESWLEGKGFKIILSEEISVREQISLFTNASCIVAHHGAGLGNIAFSRDDMHLVEIFQPSMVAPDFYQRSRFVTTRYSPIIASPSTILDDVANALSAASA